MIRNTEYPWANQTNFNWQYFCIWIKRTVNERYAKMKIYRYINQTKFKINLFARCYVIVYIDWLPDCRYFMHVVNLYTHATRTLTNVYAIFSSLQSLEILSVFITLSSKQFIWKTEILFKKTGVSCFSWKYYDRKHNTSIQNYPVKR